MLTCVRKYLPTSTDIYRHLPISTKYLPTSTHIYQTNIYPHTQIYKPFYKYASRLTAEECDAVDDLRVAAHHHAARRWDLRLVQPLQPGTCVAIAATYPSFNASDISVIVIGACGHPPKGGSQRDRFARHMHVVCNAVGDTDIEPI